jgi:uncharacterized protein (TIGR03086 family)
MHGMTDPLARFDRATAVADSVLAGIGPAQLASPTPCTEWTVRQLLNHLVGGTALFAGMMTGETVDRDADFLGDDPHEAFRAQASRLRALFAAPGALERVVPAPFGPQPAAALVEMRVNEMMVHSWDLARATGQSTDLDEELAESCIEAFRTLRASGRGGDMFADVQPVPDTAPAADRLAALAGRVVQDPPPSTR